MFGSDVMIVLHLYKNILDRVVHPLIDLDPEPFNFVVLTMAEV